MQHIFFSLLNRVPFVDFLWCFVQVKLFNEKRSDLEEQQLHLNVGLQKIRETVDQVSDWPTYACRIKK